MDNSIEALLPYARLALKETSNGYLYNFPDGLFDQLEAAKFNGVRKKPPSQGGPHRYDYSAECPQGLKNGAADVFLYLLHRGLIAPEMQIYPPSVGLDRWRITPRGVEWAAGAEPPPEDTAGYLLALRKTVPSMDGIIFQYVQEGLTALVRQTYFSAAVMLGAACEKEVYLLAHSLLDALAFPPAKKKLKEVLERRQLFKFTEPN